MTPAIELEPPTPISVQIGPSGPRGPEGKEGKQGPPGPDSAAAIEAERLRAEAAEGERLVRGGNLSELTNVAVARGNLGLGTAATRNVEDFDAAGAAAAEGVLRANAVTAEQGARIAADEVETTARTTAITTEVNARKAADKVLEEADGTETAARKAADELLIPLAQKGAHNGVATLDNSGLIPNAQLPPLALTEPFVVNSEAEQIALAAQVGDFAIRTDISKTYVRLNSNLGTMADWRELAVPLSVQSVNGKAGPVVMLTAADVGADVTGAAAAAAAASIPLTQRAAANGVATLDGTTRIPVGQLPTTALTSGQIGFVEGDVMPGNARFDQIAASTAPTNFGAVLFSFGTGDFQGGRVGAPPAPHYFDIRDGSAASPTKIGVTASYSRIDATSRAEVNAMGPVGTDGPDGATVLRASIKGTPASQVQIVGLFASAWQTGAYEEGTGADACPIYGIGRTSGGATGTAFGAYLEAQRETTHRAIPLELRLHTTVVEEDNEYKANGPSQTMGVWINAQNLGGKKSSAAFQIGHNFGSSFDAGYAINEGAVVGFGFRDDSNSEFSLDIHGTHAGAAIRVNNAGGAILVGTNKLTGEAPTQLFEIYSKSNRNPAMRLSADANISHTILFNNTSANATIGQSGGANALIEGTVAGDLIMTTGNKTVHIGQGIGTGKLLVSELVSIPTGPLLIGTKTRQAAGEALLEVYAGASALDPMVTFGTSAAVNITTQLIRNSTGQAKIFAANESGAFLTGVNQGDTGITYTAGKIFHIGAVGKTSWLRLSEKGMGFYGHAPVEKPAAYTQTFATAARVHAEAELSVVVAAGTVAELNTELNKTNKAVNELKKLVNSVIDDFQANGMFN